jgi:hypothetical protein
MRSISATGISHRPLETTFRFGASFVSRQRNSFSALMALALKDRRRRRMKLRILCALLLYNGGAPALDRSFCAGGLSFQTSSQRRSFWAILSFANRLRDGTLVAIFCLESRETTGPGESVQYALKLQSRRSCP